MLTYLLPFTAYVKCDLRARAGSDPISAADAVRTIPGFTAKQKGKGKATIFNPREDAALQAVAGRFANPAFARAHQAESNVPKQPSAEALHKVAAVEEAILVGLYTQCHETSQKIWKTEQELLILAEPWMTHQTSVIAPRLIALTSRKHLEMHFRGNDPVYSFTWAGYCSAQQYAQGKGLPAIEITRNDLTVPQVLAPQTSVTQGKAIPIADLHDSVTLAPANTVRQHATKQVKQMQTVPVPAPSIIARPSGIVSVNRSAPAAGNFTTILPRKRPAAVEESYQGLSQYTRSAAEAIAGEAAPAPAVTHRPINKRFAAPSIASVFQDKPVTAPAAHSDGKRDVGRATTCLY